jgi:signal transduction histidine kinase
VNIQKNGLGQVLAHRATLTQVFANLISNALKFTPKGQAPQIRIWAERDDKITRIHVEDKGIGIAPEHQERIFKVFERLHGSEAYPGTGIGLAIVRKGIERMGGHFGVESKVGLGSRFWIELTSV